MMNLLRFLKTRTFFFQVFLSILVLGGLFFLVRDWLDWKTAHNYHIEVPDITNLSQEEGVKLLQEKGLRLEVQDSASYNPKFPKQAILKQNPVSGSLVKSNRKIYVLLNPSGYAKIKLPELTQKTKRQIVPQLKALGFKIGKTYYHSHIAKDLVLEVRHNGKKVKKGDRLAKMSTIDLILGNGRASRL